jgi:exosortase
MKPCSESRHWTLVSSEIMWLVTAMCAALVWSYWPTFVDLWQFWQRNEDYSVGEFVLPTAIVLAVYKCKGVTARDFRMGVAGIPLFIAAQALRCAGVQSGHESLERYSLVLSIAAITLFVAGPGIFLKLKYILMFLLLMVPLPASIHEAIALPLQSWATGAAVFTLELLGFLVVREGHVLRIENESVFAVIEGCSGLRMLTAFVFVSVVLALTIRCPRWERVALLLLSVPVALISNTIRLVITAMVMHLGGGSPLSDSTHALAGLAMMPLGLAISFSCIRLLRLLTRPPDVKPAPARKRRRSVTTGNDFVQASARVSHSS